MKKAKTEIKTNNNVVPLSELGISFFPLGIYLTGSAGKKYMYVWKYPPNILKFIKQLKIAYRRFNHLGRKWTQFSDENKKDPDRGDRLFQGYLERYVRAINNGEREI